VIGNQKLARPNGQTKLYPSTPDCRASPRCFAAQLWHSALTPGRFDLRRLKHETHPAGSAPSRVSGGGLDHDAQNRRPVQSVKSREGAPLRCLRVSSRHFLCTIAAVVAVSGTAASAFAACRLGSRFSNSERTEAGEVREQTLSRKNTGDSVGEATLRAAGWFIRVAGLSLFA
jgi:hypothetical protein